MKKKLNKIDISRSFILVSDKSKEWTALRLTELTEEYKDIIYKYGKVEIKEMKKMIMLLYNSTMMC